ncbi:hypothetical protein DP185_01780 [Enterobacter hormaechei]|nr:hypothetical protein DP185_01780 [Enterobacter hormaechei]
MLQCQNAKWFSTISRIIILHSYANGLAHRAEKGMTGISLGCYHSAPFTLTEELFCLQEA